MFQKTTVILVGLATLLIAYALSIPHWHSSKWDQRGYVHTYAGLWSQMLSIKTRADKGEEKKYCETFKDASVCPNSGTRCNWDDKGKKCISRASWCKTFSEKHCEKDDSGNKKPCSWTGEKCVHEKLEEFDFVLPYNGYSKTHADDKLPLVESARVLGIVAASLALIAMVVGGMSSERPMLVAMIAGVATLCSTALLIIYGTGLQDSYMTAEDLRNASGPFDPKNETEKTVKSVIDTGVNGVLKYIFNHVLHDETNKLDMDTIKLGGSFWLTLVGTILLALATALGVADRLKMD